MEALVFGGALKKVPVILFLLSATLLFPQSSVPQDAQGVLSDLIALSAFYPSGEGTSNEKRVSDFIIERLNTLGVRFSQKSFSGSERHHSFSRFVDATIPGKKTDTVFIVVPINNVSADPDAPDTLVNVALALGFLSRSSLVPPDVTIRILFMGAEFGESTEYPLGSNIFLDDFFPDYPSIFLYLNFRDVPARVLLKGAANGIVAPNWLIVDAAETLREAGVPFLLRGNKNQLFRMGFSDDRTQIQPFLADSFPAICLEGEYGNITETEKVSRIRSIGRFLDEFIGLYSSGFPGEWDKHYLFFQVMNFFLVVNEYALMVIIITVLLLFVLMTLVFYKYVRQLLLMFVDKWWTLLFFLPITFAFSLLATFAIDGILFLKGDPEFWKVMPFQFLMFKLLFILACYLVLSPAIRHLQFPEDSRFYEKWAALFLLFDALIFSLINVSFSYYFFWAFAFVSLAVFFSDRIVKFLLYALSPVWFVKLVFDFFVTAPEYRFCNAILTNPLIGNAILATSLSPFVFLGASVFLLLGSPLRKIKTRYLNAGIAASVSCSMLFLALVLALPAYTLDHLQSVEVVNTINMASKTNDLVITSDAPLGEMTIKDDGNVYSFVTRSKKYSIPKEYIENLMSVTWSGNYFLSRKNIGITVSPKGNPYKIKCTLEAENDFDLLDSTFPFAKRKNGKSYDLQIGVNPPTPLSVQITIPGNVMLTCHIEVTYISFPFGFTVYGENKNIRTTLSVKNTIYLGK